MKPLTCSECDRPNHAAGLCQSHYFKARRRRLNPPKLEPIRVDSSDLTYVWVCDFCSQSGGPYLEQAIAKTYERDHRHYHLSRI